MTDTKNAAGAPPPTASTHKLLSSDAIVPSDAAGDQGPRDLSLITSTAYSDPDDTTATVLFGVDYSPAQLDDIAEHTRCAVLSTPATAEEVAAGAVPKLGLTLADFDDIRVIGMDSPRLTENAADRIAAVITDQAGGRLTRPEVRETITTAHLHRGTDIHLTVSSGRPVKDINGHRVLGPERSTSSTTATARPSAPAAPPVVRINAADLGRREYAEMKWAVPGLIPEGYSMLVGPPKVGKSWLALSVCLAVARDGGKVLGSIDTGPARPTLYLALEDGERRLQDRARHILGRDTAFPSALDFVISGVPEDLLKEAADFVAEHGDEDPVVVLDTLQKSRPSARNSKENAYAADYQFGSLLKRIVDPYPGASLTGLHHTNKNSGGSDYVDKVSGSHGMAGAADTILILARDRMDENGLIHVTGRDVPEGEYAIVQDGHGWKLDGATLDAAAARAQEERVESKYSPETMQVLDAARVLGGEFDAAGIAAELGPDADKAKVNRILVNLTRGNTPQLARVARGKYQLAAGLGVGVDEMFGV